MKNNGFTLIEVVIAAGIAASALILLLGANRAALGRASHARRNALIDELAESKFDQIRCLAETQTQGTFAELPEVGWALTKAPAEIEGLKRVDRLTLQIMHAADNVPIKTLQVFSFNSQSAQTILPEKQAGQP